MYDMPQRSRQPHGPANWLNCEKKVPPRIATEVGSGRDPIGPLFSNWTMSYAGFVYVRRGTMNTAVRRSSDMTRS
jgi:hypothetical protein